MAIKVDGGAQDGIYTKIGVQYDKPAFGLNVTVVDAFGTILWFNDLSDVGLTSNPGFCLFDLIGNPLYYSLSDVLTPDLAVADTTAIVVRVNFQDQVYWKSATLDNGKAEYYINGSADSQDDVDDIRWITNLHTDGFGTPTGSGWGIFDNNGVAKYYSTSNVATPDLATSWKKASDDSTALVQTFVNYITWFTADDNSPSTITVTHFNIHKMNLYNLKNVCAAYHNKVVDDLTVGEVDLFLIAANNAKKGAEKLHNFELEWVKATISVDYLTGGLFSSATTVPANTFSGLKEILSVSGTVNNCVVPIRFTRPKGVPQSYDWNLPRYPTDSQVMSSGSSCPLGLVFRGDSIVIYPTQTTAGTLPITVEGYGWLNDYDTDQVADEDSDPQDFLLAYGFDFLQWSIIIELNYVFQTFVNRQEGNVGTPTKMRDDAWEDLVDWDSNRIDPHIRDTR